MAGLRRSSRLRGDGAEGGGLIQPRMENRERPGGVIRGRGVGRGRGIAQGLGGGQSKRSSKTERC